MTTTAQHTVPATPARQYYRVKNAARVLGVPEPPRVQWRLGSLVSAVTMAGF